MILDEMNLAHVEYYFADLLSVIESGRGDDGFTKQALRIGYAEEIQNNPPPEEIHLPPNLYIIGAVNMDETTHAFSPKVLDRAFTIELTDVDFTNYPVASVDPDGAALSDGEQLALLDAFTRGGRFARIDKPEIAEIVERYPRIRAKLQSLNALLRQNRMHFGYRVVDEICQYLFNNDLNGMMTFNDAFDQAVFMKVLPKFTGSKARLRFPLLALLTWAIDPEVATETRVKEVSERFAVYLEGKSTKDELYGRPPVFGVVAERARQMLVTLERDGFVSFG